MSFDSGNITEGVGEFVIAECLWEMAHCVLFMGR